MKADGRTYLSKDQEVVAQGELNKMILDWDFLNLTDKDQREVLKERLGWEVGPFSFKKLKKLVPWEDVRGKYRKAFCMFAPQIDMALIKKAMRGDTKAIELFYTRMEGWTPRSGLDLTAHSGDVRRLDSKELMGELMKGMSEGERKALVERGELPGGLGNGVGAGSGGDEVVDAGLDPAAGVVGGGGEADGPRDDT